MEDGIHIILGYEQYCLEWTENYEEDSFFFTILERWPRHRSSLQWVFTNHKKSHTTKFHTQMHMLVTLSLENEVFFNNSF